MRYLLGWSNLPYPADKTPSLLGLKIRVGLPQEQGDEVYPNRIGLQGHRPFRNRSFKEHAPRKPSRAGNCLLRPVSCLFQRPEHLRIKGEFSCCDLREHPEAHLQLIINIYYPSISIIYQSLGNTPSAHWMMPTITPNSPRALPKISTTRIFTNESGFWASAIAQPLPDTPTQILRLRWEVPAEEVGEAD